MSTTWYTSAMPWATPQPRPRAPIVQRGMDLIGDAIRRRRVRLGWSQRELGRRTGIDQSSISRLEAGQRCGLRWSRFATIVAVLGGLEFDPSGKPAPREPPPRPRSDRQIRAAIRAQEEAEFQAVLAAMREDADEGDGADDADDA